MTNVKAHWAGIMRYFDSSDRDSVIVAMARSYLTNPEQTSTLIKSMHECIDDETVNYWHDNYEYPFSHNENVKDIFPLFLIAIRGNHSEDASKFAKLLIEKVDTADFEVDFKSFFEKVNNGEITVVHGDMSRWNESVF